MQAHGAQTSIVLQRYFTKMVGAGSILNLCKNALRLFRVSDPMTLIYVLPWSMSLQLALLTWQYLEIVQARMDCTIY